MPAKTKAIKNNIRIWRCLVGSILLICAIWLVVANLKRPGPTPPVTTDPPTTGTTQPTLPIPPLNPLGPGDFAFREDYLTCLTAPSVLGIDVSEWQENVDWEKVKAAGIEFVMIRVGWRGSEKGVLSEDVSARDHYAGASAAGLKVGAYFFSQAISPEEAVEEADFLLQTVKDWQLDMPLVYDWEYISADARTGNMDADTLTACAKAFCDRVAQAGYDPMVYFNTSQSFDLLHLGELTDYQFWLAQYRTTLLYPYRVDMWQYTDAGSVPGIEGNVDINLYFPWESP